ncbi:hypothetical protein A0H81_05009 [Grifola frondosa]|uniref:Uncharacterized protein n=1 Tax=Grifola frondosa TaxID=5627 RepID=A0A1C7ME31_GRIFR|nr:hypothetical protein A0H81_05009 [Grifola frondosa]
MRCSEHDYGCNDEMGTLNQKRLCQDVKCGFNGWRCVMPSLIRHNQSEDTYTSSLLISILYQIIFYS